MHIDWFVFLAQIVNFLILVYLLKRFLYGRIVQAMDRREHMIVSRFEEAERLKKEAEAQLAIYEEKKRQLEEKEEELLNRMIQEVEAKKKEMLEKARQDVEAIRLRWQDTIRREQESFLQDLSHRIGKQTWLVARRVLASMADETIEQRMVRVFLRRIAELDEEGKKSLWEAIDQAGGRVVIQSAFPISAGLQGEIHSALADGGGRVLDVRYEIQDETIVGIELRAHGYKLAWSIGDYLENLEETFAHALMEESRVRA